MEFARSEIVEFLEHLDTTYSLKTLLSLKLKKRVYKKILSSESFQLRLCRKIIHLN